jgi:predicted metal-dependent hydrolase
MHPLLRFTLDLFDPSPLVALKEPSKRPRRPKTPKIESNKSLAPDLYKNDALTIGAIESAVPALPMGDIMVPANFRHPKANRESRLGDAMVAYEFRRSKRRTIGFSVGPDGLVVSAPKWVPLHQMESALLERSDWIIKKLGETRERRAQLDSARIEWRDGTQIPFLGEPVIVVLDPRHAFGNAGAELQADGDRDNPTLPGVTHRTLRVALPHTATTEQIRDAVQAWLMRQVKRIFTERMNHFAPLLGVQWRKLSLSSAGTRWGSASADGSIRLNWRLVHFKMSVIDYVVAHELSHLRVMDHSPRFWDTVRAVVPDYDVHRSTLKDQATPRWD